MRSVRVHGWGQRPLVEEVASPISSEGSSLVRVHAASVGHLDRSIWSGSFMRHPPLPYVPGLEGAGLVVSSTRYPSGTRVWVRGSGLGVVRDGTWRELIDVRDDALNVLPDGIPMAVGAAFFSPSTAAWVSLNDIGQVRAGTRVLVTGATGAVGSIALQLARDAGADARAVVFDTGQVSRLQPDIESVRVEDLEPTAELLIDTVGGNSLPRVLRGVKAGGRAVLVGYTGGAETSLDIPELLQRDVSLLPLNMLRRDAAARAAAPELLALIAAGRLRIKVQEFPLEQAAEALEWIATRGRTGRAVLIS